MKKFNVVSSFLFSEPFEKEVLLLKFILENDLVCEWVLIENAYTFRGQYKGNHAKELLNSDDRFKPYIDKITIISENTETTLLDNNKVLDELAFNAEFWQRDLAHNYFMDKYNDNDWIIIADADEMVDATSAGRMQELYNRMAQPGGGVLHIATKRYWFDFDNELKMLYGIPMCTKAYLKSNNQKLHDVRLQYHSKLKMKWKQIIGFEYSGCFPVKDILQKIKTDSHMGVKQEEISQALRANHRPLLSVHNMKLVYNPWYLLETVGLTPDNSPEYVRNNLAALKTNNISVDYKKNRQEDYPEVFNTGNIVKSRFYDMKKSLVKKFTYLKRVLKLA